MYLDLNLLRAFDALLEEGTVAGAAERLYLSQPAMSRTLGRIRRTTGDQILVRTGRTMTPTPYALAVQEEVHALVQQASALLTPQREFDPATLQRTFTLQFHEAITTAIGPGLLATVQAQAPDVALRFLAEAPVDTTDLRQGRVDITIGADEPTFPEIRSETLGHDRLVLVARPGNPVLHRPLTLERYAEACHLTVSRRGRLHDPVDALLAVHGLHRRVVATAPTTTAALHFVRESDLVVAVTDRVCHPMVSALGLMTAAIPLDLPPIPVITCWHQRYEDDRAHAWLRDRVRTAVRRIYAGSAQPEH